MSVTEKLRALFEAKASKNLEAGQAFLAENALRPEVTTTESGLQYEVIKMGDGAKPNATQTVNCHYHGTTIEGVVFDSSVNRGKTIEFPLNRVIKGWTEGLQYMPVGSKFKFYIPSYLAYGNQQISAEIGPNSTLIFEVELFGVR
jgi:FKBP-type peptidyl-prolyl cis-trans isomerase